MEIFVLSLEDLGMKPKNTPLAITYSIQPNRQIWAKRILSDRLIIKILKTCDVECDPWPGWPS